MVSKSINADLKKVLVPIREMSRIQRPFSLFGSTGFNLSTQEKRNIGDHLYITVDSPNSKRLNMYLRGVWGVFEPPTPLRKDIFST